MNWSPIRLIDLSASRAAVCKPANATAKLAYIMAAENCVKRIKQAAQARRIRSSARRPTSDIRNCCCQHRPIRR